MISQSPPTSDLRSRFCERFKCPPSEYEKRALRKCLYLHARILAPLLRLLNPGCFERDLVFMDYFGKAKNWKEVADEIAALRYQDIIKPRLRVSGRRANKLAAKLLPEGNQT